MDKERLVQSIVENMAKCQRPAMRAGWKALGLSHAQMGLLYLLSYHKQSSVKQAADFLGVSKSAITQLLDPLVAKGLVRRESDPADRRIVRLSLSSEGSKVIKKVTKHKYAGIRSAMGTLSRQELEQLNKIYEKMAGSL